MRTIDRPSATLRVRAAIAILGTLTLSMARGQTTMSFHEVATPAGLQFTTHLPQPPGSPTSPAGWIGTGAAVGDYDGDGYLDVYFIDAFGWAKQLFHNNGDKTFTNATFGSGVADTGSGRIALWLDLDNDGDDDLVVANDTQGFDGASIARLFRNDAGTFVDVTAGSGFNPTGSYVGGMAATDYNGDGKLDLYVTYWNNSNSPPYNFIYRNLNGFQFVEETDAIGLRLPITQRQTWSPVFFDVDGDGDQDLYGAVDFDRDYLFQLDNGTFHDVSVAAHVIHDGQDPGANDMGIAVGDIDGDGDLDVFTTSIAFPTPQNGGDGIDFNGKFNALFINHWPDAFTEESASNERNVWLSYWGWGTVLTDLDLDGDLDLVTVGGRSAGDGGTWSDKPKQIYQNDGTGHFTEVASAAGFNHTGNSRGLVAFDYDNDGDEDILIINVNQPAALFENLTPHTNHHLVVQLVGTTRTRDAVGAKVRVTTGSKTQLRERIAGGSFVASLPKRMHFGLADATLVDQVKVDWPGGASTIIPNVPVDQMLMITEGAPPSPQLTSLTIDGPDSVDADSTATFSALGTYYYASDGPVTSGVTWSLQPAGVASIDAAGLLTVGSLGTSQPITVQASVGTTVATHMVTLAAVGVPDTTSPTVSITAPSASGYWMANAPTVTITGTASDAVGVVSVTAALSTGQSVPCTGTNSWTAGPISLNEGLSTIVITARDAASNSAVAEIVIDFSAPTQPTPTPTPTPPPVTNPPPVGSAGIVITTSADRFDFGDQQETAVLLVWNGGEGTMQYSLQSNVDWLSITPPTGESNGPDDPKSHTLRVDRSGFSADDARSAVITVRASTNASVSIPASATNRSQSMVVVPPSEPNDMSNAEPAPPDSDQSDSTMDATQAAPTPSTSGVARRSTTGCGSLGWIGIAGAFLTLCLMRRRF